METDEDGTEFYFVVLAGIMIIVLGSCFAFSSDLSLRTIWVVLNLGAGYIILMDRNMRERYFSVLKGIKERRCWFYALLMIFFVMLSVGIIFLFSSPTGTGKGAGNPFVSDYVFLAVIIPLVPVFAYAETRLFQRGMMKLIIGRYAYTCSNCGGKAIGLERCDLCGYPVKQSIPDYRKHLAVFSSAFVFSLAHVILVGSFSASLTFIGGYFMASIYIKEGWLPVARIHALYDYILIGILIGGLFI